MITEFNFKIIHISTARLSLDPSNSCWTDAGPGGPTHPTAYCKFPFKYQGKVYHKCTKQDHEKPWCALDMSQPVSNIWGKDCKKCSKEENYKWANCVFGKPCGLGKHYIKYIYFIKIKCQF